MGQPEEKSAKLDQVLRLVDELSAADRDLLLDKLKMNDLQLAIQVGIDQADRGELVDGDQVFKDLRHRNETLSP